MNDPRMGRRPHNVGGCECPDSDMDKECISTGRPDPQQAGIGKTAEGNESFTNQKRRIASEKEVSSKWGLDQHQLYCTLCGHIFAVGEGWRWVYANDGGGGHGNFEVCDACDSPDVLERYRNACKYVDAVAKGRLDARWEIILAVRIADLEGSKEMAWRHERNWRNKYDRERAKVAELETENASLREAKDNWHRRANELESRVRALEMKGEAE